jgi:hypothetical protein
VTLLMTNEVKADFTELDEAELEVDAVIVGNLGERFAYMTSSTARSGTCSPGLS